ncbi:MAG: tetraacyldisaccharide 4'-kinase, partial [Alphaproteobacteria bacterium]|nr:tetraacyldisaccharide 4'-kinase [Alphaproteobacteria bacterium]
ILVFDGKIGVGNGFLLPAGPLRETMCSGIKRADAVIIIGEQSLSTKIKKINSKIPIFYAGTETAKPVGAPRIFAFAGIGYPGKFFDALRTIRGIKGFMSRTFPDHHQYSERELIDMKKTADAQNMKLVTTAKDHVRLSPKWQKLVLVAPLTITIEPAFFKWLKEKVK